MHLVNGWAVAATVVAAAATTGQRPAITVSAAASLTNVLQEVATTYERRAGTRVILNFGASNMLARQIAAGANVDLFISADETQMDVVSSHIDRSSRRDLLANQLAIAVPDDRVRKFSSARDLTDPAIRRVAIGDAAAVPAGVYAKAYLERLGIWKTLEPKLVPSASVRLALAAVESGAADAAIVYKTDIAVARRAREAFVVPAAEGPRIVYPAAVVHTGHNAAQAREFLAFLTGPDAVAVFRRAGFLLP